MVTKTTINPQSFARGNAGQIPTAPQTQVPSLRNTPQVRDVGTESAVNAYLSAADDAKRLQNTSQKNFEIAFKEISTLQALEAEEKLSDLALASQAAMQDVRVNTEDASQIPDKSIETFDTIKNKLLESYNFSEYQQRLFDSKSNKMREVVASNALDYQQNLRAEESKFAVEKVQKSRSALVFNDPSLRDTLIAESNELVESFGDGLTALDKAQIKDQFQSEIAINSFYGSLQIDPEKALQNIDELDSYIDGDTKRKLIGIAESEIKSDQAQVNTLLREKQKQTQNDLTLALAQESIGAVDDNGEPIRYSQRAAVEALDAGLIDAGQFSALNRLRDSITTDASNPRLASELKSSIIRSQAQNRPLTLAELNDRIDAEIQAGAAPLSASQYSDLVSEVTEPVDESVSLFIENQLKPSLLEPDIATGIFMAKNNAQGKLLNQSISEIKSRVNVAAEKGITPQELFDPGSGHYIGDSLIKRYQTALKNEEPVRPVGVPENSEIIEGKLYKGKQVYRLLDDDGNPTGKVMVAP